MFISVRKSCYYFVCATTANQISFRNHRYRKVVGVEHNVVLLYADANAPDPSGVVLWNPFKWDILCSFLLENLVIFVCATTANRISFRNHRNQKFVGGKHNVVLLYVDVSAPSPSGVVLYNPFKWDILCPFLVKNQPVILCLPQRRTGFHSATTGTEKL